MIDTYLVEKIIVILINLIGFWLMFLVYSANKKEKLNQWFVAMTFFVILWINFAFLGYSTNDVQSALIFYRLNWGSVALFLVCSFYFYFIYFLKFKNKYKILEYSVLFFGIFLFVLSLFTDFIIKNVIIESWGAEIIFGYGNILFNTYSIFIGVVIIVFLIKKYFKSHEKIQKIRTKYFLFGTFLFILSNIIFNVFLPLISNSVIYQHFGDYSAIFLLGFTAYAIVKHELMGIKTLVTQILIIIISVILFVDAFFLSSDFVMQILKFGVLIAFVYFSRGMVESVRKEKKARKKLEDSYDKIDQSIKYAKDTNVKLKEKNEDLKVLLTISDIIARTLDPKKIGQDIVDSVPKNLHYLKYIASFMVLYDARTKRTYAYFITESIITKKIRKLVGKTLGKRSGEISVCLGSDDLIAKTIEKEKIQISNKLEDFIAVSKCKCLQNNSKASQGKIVCLCPFVLKRKSYWSYYFC